VPEVSFPCRYTEALVRTNNIVTRVLFTIPALFLSVPNTLEKSRKFLKNKILLDATCYFIMLVLGSTCFGHHYAHHQELTTIALVTTYAVWFWRCCWLGVKCRQNGWVSGPKAVTAFGPDTHPFCLHLTPNQQQLEKQTAYVVTNAIVVSSWWWA